jgi:hypothetical protein
MLRLEMDESLEAVERERERERESYSLKNKKIINKNKINNLY